MRRSPPSSSATCAAAVLIDLVARARRADPPSPARTARHPLQFRTLRSIFALYAGSNRSPARRTDAAFESAGATGWGSRAAAASRLSSVTIASGSSAPKTEEPATKESTPASAQRSMVSTETPPSICNQMSPPSRSSNCRVRAILGRQRSRNFCPPKPGSTVMINTMSSSGQQVRVGLDRGSGLECHRRSRAQPVQFTGQPYRRAGGLDVERHRIGPGLRVRRGPAIGLLDHQMNVQELSGDLPDRLDHRQPERQVGHEMVVHHIDVHRVRARARIRWRTGGWRSRPRAGSA